MGVKITQKLRQTIFHRVNSVDVHCGKVTTLNYCQTKLDVRIRIITVSAWMVGADIIWI